jgi:hypothetical protein
MARIVGYLVFLAFISSPLVAEEQATALTHNAAAEEFLVVLRMDITLAEATNVMLKTQLQQHPELVKFEDVMRAFLAKHLSYEALKPDLLRMYTAAFTEPELREMAAFYRTDTGRKCIELIPSMLQKGATLGAERVAEHMDELKAAIEARVKELEEKEKESPTKGGA